MWPKKNNPKVWPLRPHKSACVAKSDSTGTTLPLLVPLTVLLPVTKSVASLCGLRLVVRPKFGTNPARVAFGLVWSH
eukprot:SAG11_NODE_36243_length_262_cov_1.515337_1_plen_76_part_10